MDILKSLLKLLALAALVTLITLVAFFAGFGSGYYSGMQKAPVLVARVATTPTPIPSPSAPIAPTLPPATRAAPRATPMPVVPGPSARGTEVTPEEQQAFQVFWEAWSLLKDEYYGDLPDNQTMARAAIRGVLGTLDDKNTGLIEPQISKIINEDNTGSFEGIGASIRLTKDNQLEIARLFPGQPAEKSGLKEGDILLAVDDRSVAGFSVYEAVALIRGKAGTPVKLTIGRSGQAKPMDITITRAKIDIPIVQSKMLDGNIAYVSLYDFSSTASAQLESTLKTLLAQKPKGLILDLRDNPGGYLQQSIQISDMFLDAGVVASEKDRSGQGQTFRSGPQGIAQDIPMVVLVNGGSASASEIVAGALQDRGRAKLIGQTTYGKGSVQLPHTLSDGSELRVTIAHWFTPNNRQIQGTGLTPDITVPMTQDDVTARRDPQLDRAVQFLIQGK